MFDLLQAIEYHSADLLVFSLAFNSITIIGIGIYIIDSKNKQIQKKKEKIQKLRNKFTEDTLKLQVIKNDISKIIYDNRDNNAREELEVEENLIAEENDIEEESEAEENLIAEEYNVEEESEAEENLIAEENNIEGESVEKVEEEIEYYTIFDNPNNFRTIFSDSGNVIEKVPIYFVKEKNIIYLNSKDTYIREVYNFDLSDKYKMDGLDGKNTYSIYKDDNVSLKRKNIYTLERLTNLYNNHYDKKVFNEQVSIIRYIIEFNKKNKYISFDKNKFNNIPQYLKHLFYLTTNSLEINLYILNNINRNVAINLVDTETEINRKIIEEKLVENDISFINWIKNPDEKLVEKIAMKSFLGLKYTRRFHMSYETQNKLFLHYGPLIFYNFKNVDDKIIDKLIGVTPLYMAVLSNDKTNTYKSAATNFPKLSKYYCKYIEKIFPNTTELKEKFTNFLEKKNFFIGNKVSKTCTYFKKTDDLCNANYYNDDYSLCNKHLNVVTEFWKETHKIRQSDGINLLCKHYVRGNIATLCSNTCNNKDYYLCDNHINISEHTKQRYKIPPPINYNEKFKEFCDILKDSNAYISGSTMNKMITDMNFNPDDIDIYTNSKRGIKNLTRYLREQGFEKIKTSKSLSYKFIAVNIINVNEFYKTENSKDGLKKVQIIFIDEPDITRYIFVKFDLSICKVLFDGDKFFTHAKNDDLTTAIYDENSHIIICIDLIIKLINTKDDNNKEYIVCFLRTILQHLLLNYSRVAKYRNRGFTIDDKILIEKFVVIHNIYSEYVNDTKNAFFPDSHDTLIERIKKIFTKNNKCILDIYNKNSNYNPRVKEIAKDKDSDSKQLNSSDFDVFNTKNPNSENTLSIFKILEQNMSGDIVEI